MKAAWARKVSTSGVPTSVQHVSYNECKHHERLAGFSANAHVPFIKPSQARLSKTQRFPTAPAAAHDAHDADTHLLPPLIDPLPTASEAAVIVSGPKNCASPACEIVNRLCYEYERKRGGVRKAIWSLTGLHCNTTWQKRKWHRHLSLCHLWMIPG